MELTGDDLGWNDLGQMPNEPARQQAEIAERLALAREEAAPVAGRKAFTLRLDPARHLALRLACAVRGQSAQAFVTEALDAMLATAPVAAALPKARRGRGRKD
ncbi:hypothetical protein [Sphingomonas jatrophae]|uniref:hypothetical protein n=1 Tax=Sphingomonas jatrophae TaxID=1166337 RepID=UPI001F6074BC|nr:hypothetical protein [Sphingomonas jatrophae]